MCTFETNNISTKSNVITLTLVLAGLVLVTSIDSSATGDNE